MNWDSLIIQIPLVAAFIWYSLQAQDRYQSSMDKRDEAYLRALSRISDQVDKHDIEFRDAVSRMEERTRPRQQKEERAP